MFVVLTGTIATCTSACAAAVQSLHQRIALHPAL
jgi:hypothetical protein